MEKEKIKWYKDWKKWFFVILPLCIIFCSLIYLFFMAKFSKRSSIELLSSYAIIEIIYVVCSMICHVGVLINIIEHKKYIRLAIACVICIVTVVFSVFLIKSDYKHMDAFAEYETLTNELEQISYEENYQEWKDKSKQAMDANLKVLDVRFEHNMWLLGTIISLQVIELCAIKEKKEDNDETAEDNAAEINT